MLAALWIGIALVALSLCVLVHAAGEPRSRYSRDLR
jgi:hypothetical protein